MRLFCIVSRHHDKQDLAFWNARVRAWGESREVSYFPSKKEAQARLPEKSAGEEFLAPEVVSVDGINKWKRYAL